MNGTPAPPDAPTGAAVQSVDRALSIMEILARDGWSGVTEVARELDIHKSTVFRLVATLERRGFVEQHLETQKYRLGFALVRLATEVRAEIDIRQLARSVCERLSEVTGETVNLAVLEDLEVVNIDQVMSNSVVSVNWIGRRSRLHATSTGKVFLAHAAESLVDTYLAGPLDRLTTHTITDPERLREEFADIRTVGYGVALQELEIGLHAVAAPVYDQSGQAVAALCVSGPSYRLLAEQVDDVGALVMDGAAEVSRRLGHMGVAPGRPPEDPLERA